MAWWFTLEAAVTESDLSEIRDSILYSSRLSEWSRKRWSPYLPKDMLREKNIVLFSCLLFLDGGLVIP